MDVRTLNSSRPEGRTTGGQQMVRGYVSLSRPAPASFTDPVWVIVPSHSGDTPYGPLGWPVSHGAALPVQGTPVTLGLAIGPDGTPGVPAILSWDATYSTPASTGTVGGDLSGSLPNPTVDALQGRVVSSSAPSSNQGLVWNGTSWAPAALVNSFQGRTGSVTLSKADVTGTGVAATDVGALAAASNLSDIPNDATARTNLGLGVQSPATGGTYADSGATVVHAGGTFTGNVGSTAYTVNQIVTALKQANLLTL